VYICREMSIYEICIMHLKFIIFIASLLFVTSCNNDIPFDSEKWLTEGDMEYPYRELMVNDLIETQLYPGAKYDSIAPYLGIPIRIQMEGDNPLIKCYTIDEYYGPGMDVSVTYLKITLNSEREVVKLQVK